MLIIFPSLSPQCPHYDLIIFIFRFIVHGPAMEDLDYGEINIKKRYESPIIYELCTSWHEG